VFLKLNNLHVSSILTVFSYKIKATISKSFLSLFIAPLLFFQKNLWLCQWDSQCMIYEQILVNKRMILVLREVRHVISREKETLEDKWQSLFYKRLFRNNTIAFKFPHPPLRQWKKKIILHPKWRWFFHHFLPILLNSKGFLIFLEIPLLLFTRGFVMK